MQCPNCRHENSQEARFCEKCGAQLESESKRMTYFQKRQAKENERRFILSKAGLQAEDVADIENMDMGEVEATPISSKSAMKKTAIVKFVLSLAATIICIGLIFLLGKLKFNASLRVALIFLVFVACATGGAYAIDNGYKLRMINAMSKSVFAVKKINYGKPPYMLSGDTFYALKIKTQCAAEGCGASMHIEEYNGEFIAVCDADRSHLRKLDCSALNKNRIDHKIAAADTNSKTDEENGEGESQSLSQSRPQGQAEPAEKESKT